MTIVGPGGVGKTRLALHVVEGMAGATESEPVFVPLAVVRGADYVPAAILNALGMPEPVTGATPALVADAIGERELLLVLDNFEHVTDAAPVLAFLSDACPGLQQLVTSRVRLRLSGETTFQLEPLTLPGPELTDWQALGSIDSVALFIQRAQSVNPGFALTERNAADLARICTRLDGLPLAIELAAARTRVISPSRLLELLEARAPLLSGGPADAPERLRTMHAAIEWSYQLLDPRARAFFRRLAIFIGGWDIDGAGAVAAALDHPGVGDHPADVSLLALDYLESLIDHSLIRRSTGPSEIPRFTMLETLREFGLDELRRHGELEEVGAAHAAYCLRLATEGTRELGGASQTDWLNRLDADYPNVRSALERALERDDAASGLALCNAIAWYWRVRGLIAEARAWVEAFLGQPSVRDVSKAGLAAALRWNGELIGLQGDAPGAEARLSQSLELFRKLEDRPGIAGVSSAIGIARIQSGWARESIEPFLEASRLYRELGELRRVAFFDAYAALGIGVDGDGKRARALARAAGQLAVSLGGERSFEVAYVELVLGFLAVFELRYIEAVPHVERSISISEELSSLLIVPTAYAMWARIEIESHRPERALELMRKGFPISIETGFRLATSMMIANLISLCARQAQWRHGAFLLGALEQFGTGYRASMPARQEAEWQQERRLIESHVSADVRAAARQTGLHIPVRTNSFELLASPLLREIMPGSSPARGTLSRREEQVLALIAEGLSDREIASRLSISRPTASKHVSAILTKMGVRTRAAAAALANQTLH
ncbi:MAG: LuxR C-terminal-related transcriptional regulator [Nocardioides sp.]